MVCFQLLLLFSFADPYSYPGKTELSPLVHNSPVTDDFSDSNHNHLPLHVPSSRLRSLIWPLPVRAPPLRCFIYHTSHSREPLEDEVWIDTLYSKPSTWNHGVMESQNGLGWRDLKDHQPPAMGRGLELNDPPIQAILDPCDLSSPAAGTSLR